MFLYKCIWVPHHQIIMTVYCTLLSRPHFLFHLVVMKRCMVSAVKKLLSSFYWRWLLANSSIFFNSKELDWCGQPSLNLAMGVCDQSASAIVTPAQLKHLTNYTLYKFLGLVSWCVPYNCFTLPGPRLNFGCKGRPRKLWPQQKLLLFLGKGGGGGELLSLVLCNHMRTKGIFMGLFTYLFGI